MRGLVGIVLPSSLSRERVDGGLRTTMRRGIGETATIVDIGCKEENVDGKYLSRVLWSGNLDAKICDETIRCDVRKIQ